MKLFGIRIIKESTYKNLKKKAERKGLETKEMQILMEQINNQKIIINRLRGRSKRI